MDAQHAEKTSSTDTYRLEVTSEQLDLILDHLRQWLPNEGCGLLGTEGDRVARVYPGTNVAHSQTFYEMDPKQVLDAMRDMDQRGIRLGAIFHSHPSSEAYPSPTDKELIFDPDVYMMIVSLAGDEPDVRAFRYDGEVQEVSVEVIEMAEGTDE